MSDARPYVLPPRGSALDPNLVEVTWSWKVSKDPSSCHFTSTFTSTPKIDRGQVPHADPIVICNKHALPVIPGTYSFVGGLQGTARVESLPVQLGDHAKELFLSELTPHLCRYAQQISLWLTRLPSDTQILTCAQYLLAKCLGDLASGGFHLAQADGHIPTLNEILPAERDRNLIKITGAPCVNPVHELVTTEEAGCDDETFVEVVLTQALKDKMILRCGDHGVAWPPDPSYPITRVNIAFVRCYETPFAGWLNEQLATRVRQAYELIAQDSVARLLKQRRKIFQVVDANFQTIAEAFGIKE